MLPPIDFGEELLTKLNYMGTAILQLAKSKRSPLETICRQQALLAVDPKTKQGLPALQELIIHTT